MITKDCTASGRNPLRRAEYNGHKALYDGCTGNQLISPDRASVPAERHIQQNNNQVVQNRD